MSEEYLIRNCAPTLAGIKTGSLFTCPCRDQKKLLDFIRRTNEKMQPKGLLLLPLRFSENKALIYLYRPQKLSDDLSDATAAGILAKKGYNPACCGKCVSQLARRIRKEADFPHEIGLFLGYPPEDVCGFMENRDCNCKCIGCWRVYGDEVAAKKKFAQYKKCTRLYYDLWAKGKSIERLTVAC